MSERRWRRWLRAGRDLAMGLGAVSRLRQFGAHLDYLDREVSRLQAAARREAWLARRASVQASQTRASFDYQWAQLPTGRALPSDSEFMRSVPASLVEMVGQPAGWFAGKRVVDVGCGGGRYTCGLLSLGAEVVACDQSEAALQSTARVCHAFADRLALKRIDLLEWSEPAAFDLAFCYGVVHHTGNTYLAMEHVCRKVRPGGRVFFMIYAPPRSLAALNEINEYEQIAAETRDLSFKARQTLLEQRFGTEAAHGWFDATSPRINDRLTFEEIHDLLTELGFGQIRHATVLRNHHVVADRLS